MFRSFATAAVALVLITVISTIHADVLSVTTPSGRAVLTSFIASRYPALPTHLYAHALYEYTGRTLESQRSYIPVAAAHDTPHHDKYGTFRTRVSVRYHGSGRVPGRPHVRRKDGFTFVFDTDAQNLLAAWGPALSLRPLSQLPQHKNMYINYLAHSSHLNMRHDFLHFTPRANHSRLAKHRSPIATNTRLSATGPCASGKKHTFEMWLQADKQLCQQYSSTDDVTHVLEALLEDAAVPFLEKTCIEFVATIGVPWQCREDYYGVTNADLASCPVGSTHCSRPTIMLETFRNKSRHSYHHRRDAGYLVTGIVDGTSAVGAAYLAAACSYDYAYGWVEGVHPIVLAHEIGHTLGAPHSKEGIMRSSSGISEVMTFSDESASVINSFVDKSWNAWCLTFTQNVGPAGQAKLFHTYRQTVDIALGTSRKRNMYDLYVLEFNPSRSDGSEELVVKVPLKGHRTIHGNRQAMWFESFSIPSFNHRKHTAAAIAVASLRDTKSTDIVVFASDASGHGKYRVGYGLDPTKDTSDTVTGGWGNAIAVPHHLGDDIQCMGATIGDIRGENKQDIILIYVDRRNGINEVHYRIGSNLNAEGRAIDGWSDEHQVPGWVGFETSAVSVDIVNLVGDRAPDLAVFHFDSSPGLWRGFFRMGRDMGYMGEVRNGWSNYVPVKTTPNSATYVYGGMAILETNAKDPRPIVLLSGGMNEFSFNEPVSHVVSEVDIDWLSRLEFSESEIKPVRMSSMDCERCYKGESIKYCRKTMSVCMSKLDHFHVVHMDALERKESPRGPSEDSIYCEGFHGLYIAPDDGNCRMAVELERLFAAGVLYAISKEIDEIDGTLSPTITSKISYTSGKSRVGGDDVSGGSVNQNGANGRASLPKAAEITITSNRWIRTKIIRAAVRELQSSTDYALVFQRKKTSIAKVGQRTYLVTAFYKVDFHGALHG